MDVLADAVSIADDSEIKAFYAAQQKHVDAFFSTVASLAWSKGPSSIQELKNSKRVSVHIFQDGKVLFGMPMSVRTDEDMACLTEAIEKLLHNLRYPKTGSLSS